MRVSSGPISEERTRTKSVADQFLIDVETNGIYSVFRTSSKLKNLFIYNLFFYLQIFRNYTKWKLAPFSVPH